MPEKDAGTGGRQIITFPNIAATEAASEIKHMDDFNIIQPRLNDALKFVGQLGLDPDQVLIQIYPTREKQNQGARPWNRLGNLQDLWPRIVEADSQGASISISPNIVTGAKQADVETTNCVWADDDTPRDEFQDDWPIPPHLVNESSLGKFHYIWLLEPGCIEPKEAGKIQAAIAANFGTDASLSDYSKKIRLPGTVHRKHDPWLVRTVYTSNHSRYGRERILAAFSVSGKASTNSHDVKRNADGKIGEGGRNDFLFKQGSRLRGMGLSEPAILAELQELNKSECAKQLLDSEIQSIAASVAGYEPNAKRYSLTDAGNSERFADAVQGKLCSVYGEKNFRAFDGKRWREDMSGEAEKMAVEVVRSILVEAANIEDDAVRAKLITWEKKSESLKSRKAMIDGARPLLHVNSEKFDADPWNLNVQNGLLDLRSGELSPHKPDQYCSKLAGCEYVPGATAPRWSKFINEFTCGDVELARYLQKFCGYSLTGDFCRQAFDILNGPQGVNGKSVFASIITKMLGDYVVSIRPDFLLEKGKDTALEGLELRGARLAVAHEMPELGHIAESRIKVLTGNDSIKARGHYQAYETFQNTAKLLLLTNFQPQLRNGGSSAFWRRARLTPCNFVAGDKADLGLTEKLLTELPGVLTWAFEGLQLWLSEGETIPTAMAKELEAYREREDKLGAFLSEYCNFHSNGVVAKSELYKFYKAWAEEAGEYIVSQSILTKRLRDRGITEHRTAFARCYQGIELKPSHKMKAA